MIGEVDFWFWFDIMTPDPLSHQTVHRLVWKLHWVGPRPALAGAVESATEASMKGFNAHVTDFFQTSAQAYLEGPPYENPTLIDGKIRWVLE